MGGGGAVRSEELRAPGGGDVRGELGVVVGVPVVAEDPCDVAELRGRAVEVGGGNRSGVGDEGGGDGPVEGLAAFQPLAVVPAAVPQVVLVGQRLGGVLAPGGVPSGRRGTGGEVDPPLG